MFQIDEDQIRQIARLLHEVGLSEIEIEQNKQRLRLVRAKSGENISSPVEEAPAAVSTAEPVLAPMIGTAYLSPEPGALPFVSEGQVVQENQTLLIIEAMKVMNLVKASRGGQVKQVLVADGAPVEYGEILMLIDPIPAGA